MKKAILMISFGTSEQSQLTKSILPCIHKVKIAYPTCKVLHAFSSKVIREKLVKQGVAGVLSVEEALEQVIAAGYHLLFVQPLYFMAGKEYDKLKGILDAYKPYCQMTLGPPLLQEGHLEEIVRHLHTMMTQTDYDASEAYYHVWIGHGSDHQARTVYKQLDDLLKASQLPGAVVMLEELGRCSELVEATKAFQKDRIMLRPLMLVAGRHLVRDIRGADEKTWEGRLSVLGQQVEVDARGLGEQAWVQDLFVQFIR